MEVALGLVVALDPFPPLIPVPDSDPAFSETILVLLVELPVLGAYHYGIPAVLVGMAVSLLSRSDQLGSAFGIFSVSVGPTQVCLPADFSRSLARLIIWR